MVLLSWEDSLSTLMVFKILTFILDQTLITDTEAKPSVILSIMQNLITTPILSQKILWVQLDGGNISQDTFHCHEWKIVVYKKSARKLIKDDLHFLCNWLPPVDNTNMLKGKYDNNLSFITVRYILQIMASILLHFWSV